MPPRSIAAVMRTTVINTPQRLNSTVCSTYHTRKYNPLPVPTLDPLNIQLHIK